MYIFVCIFVPVFHSLPAAVIVISFCVNNDNSPMAWLEDQLVLCFWTLAALLLILDSLRVAGHQRGQCSGSLWMTPSLNSFLGDLRRQVFNSAGSKIVEHIFLSHSEKSRRFGSKFCLRIRFLLL